MGLFFFYWKELCFDTGDLSSIPSFQTFLDHSGMFPTQEQARAARKHDQPLKPLCQKIGLLLTTTTTLLYSKTCFLLFLLLL